MDKKWEAALARARTKLNAAYRAWGRHADNCAHCTDYFTGDVHDELCSAGSQLRSVWWDAEEEYDKLHAVSVLDDRDLEGIGEAVRNG